MSQRDGQAGPVGVAPGTATAAKRNETGTSLTCALGPARRKLADLYFSKGGSLAAVGDKAAATTLLQKCLKLDAGHERASALLKRLQVEPALPKVAGAVVGNFGGALAGP